ncbi:hypothetical protein [Chitinophaga sp. RAB17]|uniref:hypothetical protein n=1 Tax=Chitinophaga sp. RAB17 TaxID=3233049 RepID=UPI003F9130CB
MKKQLFNLPYSLLLITALVLAIVPFFFEGQSEVIHLFHHTVFIVSEFLMWMVAFIFLLGWIIYVITRKLLLTEALTWIHLLITIIISCFLLTVRVWAFKYPSDNLEVILYKGVVRSTPREIKISLLLKLLFAIGQITYVVNIIGGIVKNRKAKVIIMPSK